MPATLSYPGVYIEELPSGVRTITGVATSITAFVGRAWKGPVDEPISIGSWADYERNFGGLWNGSMMSYAVQQFFDNGGSQALIVRVASATLGTPGTAATFTLGGGVMLQAASVGSWAMNLTIEVQDRSNTKDTTDLNLFNLMIFDDPGNKKDSDKRGGTGVTETFRNVSADTNSPRFVGTILAQQSNLVRLSSTSALPSPTTTPVGADLGSGTDGMITSQSDASTEVQGDPTAKTGMYALQKADLFNLLCIPPLTFLSSVGAFQEADVPMLAWTAAANLCKDRRALLVVDAPADWASGTVNTASTKISDFSAIERASAAIYFPRLRIPDPLQENNLADFAPCGAVAGIMARTDAERGVWKAPAGIDAAPRGVLGLSVNGLPATLNNDDSGTLNPLGINCIRNFPATGHAVWGARTMEGSDVLASQWKYVPVRRLALFLEESLWRGTQWVVFEPNDEPLWAQIRLNLGAFMHGLFVQGAFQGQTRSDAYFVKCDKETTTQNDIDLGIVNIVVGFAPLKPAEFVVIQIQQMAGQIQT